MQMRVLHRVNLGLILCVSRYGLLTDEPLWRDGAQH